jgi:tRNA-modifying protein YgfZ
MTTRSTHDTSGARWADEHGVRVVRNYGDPAGEYEAARNDVAVVERTDRSILRAHGRDPVKMVQGLITNDIANAPETRAVYAAVLTPKGKMVADLRVLRRGAELLIDVAAGARDGLVAHLKKFVPPLFARFEPADDAWRSMTVCGPHARERVAQAVNASLESVQQEGDVVTATYDGGDVIIIATSQLDVPAFDILCAASAYDALWQHLVDAGARPAGHATLQVLRVEAGRPQWGRELDENTIPLEANLRTRAISETKGCYTGQEVIVRILHRGHVNWILRRLLMGDVPAPAQGAPLFRPGETKQVGRVTSAVWSPKYGQTIGLGYVRREVAPGEQLQLGDALITTAEAGE